MRYGTRLLICWAFFHLGVAPATSAEPTVAQVLRSVRQASGGDRWSAIQQIDSQGRLAVGGLEGSITGSDSLIDTRNVERASLSGIMRNAGYDGRTIWTSDESGLVDLVEGEAAQREWTTGGFLSSRAYLRPLATEQAALRSEGLAGRSFQVVSLTPRGGEPVELWVDAQTHLIARVVLPLQKSTTEWSDYRSVRGLMLPHRFQSNSESGNEQTIQVSAYRLRPTLNPATFQRPESRANDVRLASPSELPAIIDRGMIAVRVVIGKAAPLPFLLDTGANVNVLTPMAAAALNIEARGSLKASGVGAETVTAGLAKVPRMSVGAAVLENQTFVVLPTPPLFVTASHGREAVAGALGYDFFRRLIVGIDYGTARVSLAPLRSCGVAPAHTAQLFLDEGRMPQIEATLDGVTGLWTLDTGNTSATTMTTAMAEHLGIPADAGAHYVTNGGVGGTLPVRALRHERFELAGLHVSGSVFHITAQRNGTLASPRFVGNLGYTQLRHFALRFDYECRRLSVTAAPVPAPDRDDHIGVVWNMRNVQQAEVLHVVPGSPAARAGLREKDVMIELDGKPAGVLETDRWSAVSSAATGTQLRLVMQRGDQRYHAAITLQEFIPRAPARNVATIQ